MNRPIDWRIIISIVAAITIIEVTALLNGFDGKLLTLVLMVLAGLGGLSLPQLNIKR